MPNHSMNSGTSAKEGIGISALTRGRKKFSTRWKRAIRMPSGKPTTTAREKPNITRYMVKAACSIMLPSATWRTKCAHGLQRRQQRRREIAAARRRLVEAAAAASEMAARTIERIVLPFSVMR